MVDLGRPKLHGARATLRRADVLAWWLVERTKPTPVPRRKVDRQRLQALPRHLRGGWTHMQISQYLSLRTAEMDPQRYGVVRRAA